MFDLVYVGNYRPQVGGAAISCHQLLTALAERGCRCRVLASMTAEAEDETRAFDAAESHLEYARFPVPFYFNQPYQAPPEDWERATRVGVREGLERLIAEARPDALLLREGWIEFAAPVALERGIPMIALVRGNPTAAILAGTYPPELADAYLGWLRKVDRIVTVAEHFLPGLRRLGFDNVCSIPNSVDVRTFTPEPRDPRLAAALGVRESDVVVLHAGHIKAVKRPLDMVRSAPEVLRRNPDVLYLILGEDVDGGALQRDMEDEARAGGVFERFRFAPYVDYARMPAHVNLADLVVMPSEREGLARAYLETMACGKTLLASDIAAAREVVRDGENGLLFPKGDVDALAERTVQAASDPALRARLGVAARADVQRHDIRGVAARYLDVIRGGVRRRAAIVQ